MLVIALIICAAAAAAAATGFGFNLLSVPLLMFLYPPRVVVTLTLLLGVFASGMLLLRREIRRGIDWGVVRPLFLSSLVGMPAGLALSGAIRSAFVRGPIRSTWDDQTVQTFRRMIADLDLGALTEPS